LTGPVCELRASSGWIFMIFCLPESCMDQYHRLAFASRPFSSHSSVHTLRRTVLMTKSSAARCSRGARSSQPSESGSNMPVLVGRYSTRKVLLWNSTSPYGAHDVSEDHTIDLSHSYHYSKIGVLTDEKG
jgi:hypothetical protein